MCSDSTVSSGPCATPEPGRLRRAVLASRATPWPVTYQEAGVDIDAGDALVERIKPLARRTRLPEVVDGVGGFAGLCGLPATSPIPCW